MLRLLVINPNTTTEITDKVAEAICALAPEHVEVHAFTGAFGPRYIASRATFAIASHASLDVYARQYAGAHAVLLGCFGDPGLDAIREVASVPVIGLIEASVAACAAYEGRYSIVTGGVLWPQMLTESLRARGLDKNLASICAVAPTGGQIASDPEGALGVLADACLRAVKEDGAACVILGGAGLVGLAEKVQARIGYPVICSVEAGAQAAFAAMATSPTKSEEAGKAPAIDSIGLSPALADMIAGRSEH
jgi:Asp/Glu/hydantoin racemase